MTWTRLDYAIIASYVPERSKVLDLGCGQGELLAGLIKSKHIKGFGIELEELNIYACVEKAVSVYHGDLERGLGSYRDNAFDVVILSHSLQEVRDFDFVLHEALRVGRKVIVSFPNFAYWRARCDLFFRGRAPVTKSLPHSWHNSPNVHFFSINDFIRYCRFREIQILDQAFIINQSKISLLPNWRAQSAVFVLDKILDNDELVKVPLFFEGSGI